MDPLAGPGLLKSDELSMYVIPRGNAQICDLQPSQFTSYFQSLTEHFDLVLVDSPPVNVITDVQILAASCDATCRWCARVFDHQQEPSKRPSKSFNRSDLSAPC